MEKPTTSFNDLSLSPMIQEGLKRLEFTIPTPIQAKAIPIAMKNDDLIACAQTGTGKTAAFSIPLLQKLEAQPDMTALVLVPTRELGTQIRDFIVQMLGPNSAIRLALLIGGISLKQQLKMLRRDPRIYIATPGRLADHLRRETLNLDSTRMLVLDEADRMLEMGFAEQLNEIVKYLPRERQTFLFSATIQGQTQKIAAKYLHKPVFIKVGETSQPIKKIKQSNVTTEHKYKLDTIMDEINSRKGTVLIFVKTRRGVERLYKELVEYGYPLARIHGDRTQTQRDNALNGFKKGTYRILVATDVAARGVDIPNIEVVINFDPPQTSEDYIHRIGRTARAGTEGEALNIVTPENKLLWEEIQNSLAGKPGRRMNPAKKFKKNRPPSSGASKTNHKKPTKKTFAKKAKTDEQKNKSESPTKKKKSASAKRKSNLYEKKRATSPKRKKSTRRAPTKKSSGGRSRRK